MRKDQADHICASQAICFQCFKAGVDFADFDTGAPLIDCTIAPASGSYTTVQAAITLRLGCRNAVEYRLTETGDLGALPFVAFAEEVPFTLSSFR